VPSVRKNPKKTPFLKLVADKNCNNRLNPSAQKHFLNKPTKPKLIKRNPTNQNIYIK